MTANFTPGDWTLQNEDQIIALHSDEQGKHETPIAEIFHEHHWAAANARLICAAPDLLMALSILVLRQEGLAAKVGDTTTPWLDEARAAIRRAT